MKLELENGNSISNPTDSQIEEALITFQNQQNSFLILEHDSNQFMQIALHQDKGFYIEYHKVSEGKHYKSIDKFNSFEETVKTLTNYSRNNHRWHFSHTWEKLPGFNSSSSSFFSLSTFLLLLGLATLIGIYAVEKEIEDFLGLIIDGKKIYIATVAIGLTLPTFWEDFVKWETLRIDEKAYAVSAYFLFFLMIIMSICTYFGIGNF
jgi:hypothetical protein